MSEKDLTEQQSHDTGDIEPAQELMPEPDEEAPVSRRFTVYESRAERVLGIIFLAFGLLLFFALIPWQIKDVPSAEWYNAPRFFPRAIAAMIFVLGGCMFINGFRKRAVPLEQQKTYSISVVELKLVLITFGLLVVYVIALEWVPYIPATVVVLAAMIWCYGQRRIVKIITASVAMPVIIYLAFTYLLKLRLP